MTREDSTDQNSDISWNEHPLKDQLVIKTGSIPKTEHKTWYTQMDDRSHAEISNIYSW